MDNIDLKISEEINNEQKPKEKGLYRKLEDCYYNTLDKINKVFPIYKIVDPIDKVVPSFIIVNIFFLLFIAAIIIVLVLLLNSSAMKVNFDFYYDNARVNENLLVNISYNGFDKNFNTDKNSLVLKLNKDLEIKLKVLSENYEFERSYPIVENYIKVNIPKKEIIDTTPKKISIFAYEYPNRSTIYNSNIMLSLRCLSSGRTENISLAGLKEYDKAYDCGNIRFTGNVSGFNPIDFTCSNTETSCAIPLVTFTDRTPEEENLTPKNNLNVYVTDENKNILQNVIVKLYKTDSTISSDKNTDMFGKVVYPSLDVGQYKLLLQYDYNGINYSFEDKNVFIIVQATDIRKDYVIKLAKDEETEATLKLKVNTFDGNEIDFKLYLYDTNGNLDFSRSGETPESYSTNLLKGDYYLTIVPEEEYDPEYLEKISLTQDLDLNVILTAYNENKYFRFGVRVKDDKNNFVNSALVSVRHKDNNNLVYFEKNTNKNGLAEFILPNTLDYLVFARKNSFFGSGIFDNADIKNGLGGITIKITRENKIVPLTFTLDNRNVDYKVFVDYSDENAFFEGKGKTNLSIIPDKKFDLSIVVDTGFDVYTYLVTPLMIPNSEKYDLKYNYDTDLNVKATDLRLDYMLSKDVNDLNLLNDRQYYFGIQTKLNCIDEQGTANINYNLSNLDAFKFDKSLIFGENNYVTLNSSKIDFVVVDKDNPLPCSDDVTNYHYMFNTSFNLNTLSKNNSEGNLIYDSKTISQKSPKLNFKIGFNPVCDILARINLTGSNTTVFNLFLQFVQTIMVNMLLSEDDPVFIPILLFKNNTNLQLIFNSNCGDINVNNNSANNSGNYMDYNIVDYGEYIINFNDYNYHRKIYVLENYSLFDQLMIFYAIYRSAFNGRAMDLDSLNIDMSYNSDINCLEQYCSVYQVLKNQYYYNDKNVFIISDNLDKGKYAYNWNTNQFNLKSIDRNITSLFNFIPYREVDFLNTFNYNKPYGTCIKEPGPNYNIYWNNMQEIPYCLDNRYSYTTELNINFDNNFPIAFKNFMNIKINYPNVYINVDLNISKGILIYPCQELNCISDTAKYILVDKDSNFVLSSSGIIDFNTTTKKLDLKIDPQILKSKYYIFVIDTDMDKYIGFENKYDLTIFQNILDYENKFYLISVYLDDSLPEVVSYWNISQILEEFMDNY